MAARPDVFHWNHAMTLLNDVPDRALVLGLSYISEQLDALMERMDAQSNSRTPPVRVRGGKEDLGGPEHSEHRRTEQGNPRETRGLHCCIFQDGETPPYFVADCPCIGLPPSEPERLATTEEGF